MAAVKKIIHANPHRYRKSAHILWPANNCLSFTIKKRYKEIPKPDTS